MGSLLCMGWINTPSAQKLRMKFTGNSYLRPCEDAFVTENSV